MKWPTIKLREEETSLISSVAKLKSDAEEHERVINGGLTKDIQSLRSERSNIGESVKNSNSELRAIHTEIASGNERLNLLKEETTKKEILIAGKKIDLKEMLKVHEERIEADYVELGDRAKEIDEKIHNNNLRANELDSKESEFNKREIEFNKEMDIKNIQVISKENALNSGIKSLEDAQKRFGESKADILKRLDDSGQELADREQLVREEEIKIQEEMKTIETNKADIIKSINDLKTNWKVFKREKEELVLKLKKLGG